jgi:hypothetical protein
MKITTDKLRLRPDSSTTVDEDHSAIFLSAERK